MGHRLARRSPRRHPQARRGELIDVLEPGLGFVTDRAGEPVGLLTYRFDEDAVELSALVAEPRHRGIGSTLLTALETAVRASDRHWIWVVTTNDNLDALRFYQRRGFRIGKSVPERSIGPDCR